MLSIVHKNLIQGLLSYLGHGPSLCPVDPQRRCKLSVSYTPAILEIRGAAMKEWYVR